MNNLVLESTESRDMAETADFDTLEGAAADVVSVLIISSSAYLRVWVGRLLEREPGLCILDRVSSVGHGVRQAKRLRPDLVVCDPSVARDPFLATLFAHGGGEGTRVVIVDPGLAPAGAAFAVPVETILHQDLPPIELARALRRIGGLEELD